MIDLHRWQPIPCRVKRPPTSPNRLHARLAPKQVVSWLGPRDQRDKTKLDTWCCWCLLFFLLYLFCLACFRCQPKPRTITVHVERKGWGEGMTPSTTDNMFISYYKSGRGHSYEISMVISFCVGWYVTVRRHLEQWGFEQKSLNILTFLSNRERSVLGNHFNSCCTEKQNDQPIKKLRTLVDQSWPD